MPCCFGEHAPCPRSLGAWSETQLGNASAFRLLPRLIPFCFVCWQNYFLLEFFCSALGGYQTNKRDNDYE